MNSSEIGTISEHKCIAKLIEDGYTVSVPTGNYAPYDLIADNGLELTRIQVKTGKLTNGVVQFRPVYGHRGNEGTKLYSNIDSFMVYCPQLNSFYLVPAEDCTSHIMYLRVDRPKNNQKVKVKEASLYEI